VVQTKTVFDVGYVIFHSECPEVMFGLESAMTIEGNKDPYMRASMIEYMQYMRLTDPLAVKPKFYAKE